MRRSLLLRSAAAAAGIAVLAVLGSVLPVYWVYLLSAVAITAIIARGIGIVTQRAGMITLCQMSFAAIGGWVVSWAALAWPGVPFPLLVLGGGCVAAPIGALIGLATARIRGIELAIVTLGLAAALDLVLRQGSFPGVGSGTPVLPGAPFDDPRGFFALAWGLLLALQLGLLALERTRVGAAWAAVRSGERAAAALGVGAAGAKAGAFAAGALLAGVAGGMLAGQYGLLTTTVFSPLTSLMQLVTAVLCGAGLFSGAVLAGALSVFMPEVLRRLGLPLDVGNALLAIGAFDVLRRGSGGIAEQARAALQARAFRGVRLVAVPPAAEGGGGGADPAAGAEPALRIDGLVAGHGALRVLDGVDLVLHRGEVHALIGPNGAGKSTLVDAVTGFLPLEAGTVALAGRPLAGVRARERAAIGLRRTFQQPRRIDGLTVGEYLRLADGAGVARGAGDARGAGRGGSGSGSRAARIRLAREHFGLPEERVPIRLLDAGSLRVLELAGAVVGRPVAALLDEPAAGLGAEESAALADCVRRIPGVFGCAVLVIEHDMAFVRAAASRATVLEEGRAIASGPVAETLADARVVAAYLGTGAA